MCAARLPSRAAFSSVHAGGQLRFLATNLNTHSSYFGPNHVLGKDSQGCFSWRGTTLHVLCFADQTKSNTWGGFISALAQEQAWEEVHCPLQRLAGTAVTLEVTKVEVWGFEASLVLKLLSFCMHFLVHPLMAS